MMGSVDFLYTDWYTNNEEINQMDNREMLLDTALSLFYEKGYDAVGVKIRLELLPSLPKYVIIINNTVGVV